MKKKANKKIKKKNNIKNFFTNPVVVTVLFAYLLLTFLYVREFQYEQDIESEMITEGERILDKVITKEVRSSDFNENFEDITFIIGDEVDIERLKKFSSMSYDKIKEYLNIDNDFCIHFEDKEGNFIDISSITGRTGIGIGSSDMFFEVLDEHGNVVDTLRCS